MNDSAKSWQSIVMTAIEDSAGPGRVRALGHDKVPGATFEELGFSSLATLELCILVQVETGVDLTMDQLAELGTPEKVIAYISANS